MKTDQFDICCIGHITKDKVVTTRSTVHMPGGTSYYFSNAIHQMDVRYMLVTALAENEMHFVQELQDLGIEVRALPSRHTVYFENNYEENQDHRTQRVLSKADPFTPGDLAGIRSRIFHLGPLLADDIPVASIRSLAANGKVSLDVQGYLRMVRNKHVLAIDWEAKREALQYVHVLKANESEMEVLTGQPDVRISAAILAGWGVKEVVITLGSKGSVIFDGHKFYEIPAYIPTTAVVDATGCGDTYMAGYLLQRSRGADIQYAGEFAAAMATLKIEGSGPFRGTENDVLTLLTINKRKRPAIV